VPSPIRTVGISTGGGDAPGLNAVIRSATFAAVNRGWNVVGIRDGFNGIFMPERFPAGGIVPLDRRAVRGIAHLGGTIIGTTNRGAPTNFPVEQPDGTWIEVDRSAELVGMIHDAGIDALITVGGDGSLAIGHRLAQEGLRVVGVPKTIDNDLEDTAATFGFDSAVSFATECIDRVFSTAASHARVMVVEVMGRYAGWIALCAGMAASAHAILIPEIPYDLAPVVDLIRDRERRHSLFTIVVVAEGATPKGGTVSVLGKAIGQAEKLGGVGEKIARQLEVLSGREARSLSLGHLLRGGSPTAADRLLGYRFGAAAVRALDEGQTDVMVALDPPLITCVPLSDVAGRMKRVPPESDIIQTARDLGICFGD